MKRFRLVSIMATTVIAVGLMTDVSVAAASSVSLCVPTTSGEAVKSGACGGGGTTVSLPASATDQETLISILPYIKFEAEGVAKKPTIQFSGVNVQIINGEGATATVNGEGNLVIGYNEHGEGVEQTGSHDLILGENQVFTSFGGIVAGLDNAITGHFASVTGGTTNEASGPWASVTGGYGNIANATGSSVNGGRSNTASNMDSWVGGGGENTASGELASVGGGGGNTAHGFESSVSGGVSNTAKGQTTSISGGDQNTAIGAYSWIGGGFENLVEAGGRWASIYGGKKEIASKEYEARP